MSDSRGKDNTIQPASLRWENGTPYSNTFNDTYFSSSGGLEETQHVFLKNNSLEAKLKNNTEVTIAETGFGSGLNFLCAWQLQQRAAPNTRLHYISVEKFPLTAEDLETALQHWPELKPYADQLIAQYPPLASGFHRLDFGPIQLTLCFGDAAECFAELSASVDTWFLDGFSPAKNPDMWSTQLFTQMARLSKPGTTFATFTVASAVREGLEAAGFKYEKAEGYGRKRHMLRGYFSGHSTTEASTANITKPWFNLPKTKPREDDNSAIVIGAGLAGCNAAHALAKRGWDITLIDRHDHAATEASGNNQGVLYCKLSAEPSPSSAFYLAGYLFSMQLLQKTGLDYSELIWGNCGVLQLASSPEEMARQQQALLRNPQPEAILHAVSAEEASALAGTTIHHPGIFYPSAGWAQPPALCKTLIDHPGIKKLFGQEVASAEYDGQDWSVFDSTGHCIATAPILIIANAQQAKSFAQTSFLPLKPIRGQVSSLPLDSPVSLKTVVCAEGYVAPPLNEQLSFGATFNLDTDNPNCREEDHQSNLMQLTQLVPKIAEQLATDSTLTSGSIEGRVGFRCTTPDYLPIVGPVPDYTAFISTYAKLRKDAKTPFSAPAPHMPGLYLSVGHGSKGLTSAPIAGELLASMVCNEPLPLPQKIINALNPARFIVRDLIRNRI